MSITKESILQAILLKEFDRMQPEISTFEDDPMQFILRKYQGLNKVLTYLMTPSFEEYITGIYIVAPKPTTFKIVLHNGQFFFLQFMGKAYQATVAGKNYYLMNIGEKERCMLAIARILRFGNPLKTKGPEGAEQATRDEKGGEESAGGEEAPAPEEGGAEEEPIAESKILEEVLKKTLVGEAGKSLERQEWAFIEKINSAVGELTEEENKGVNVKAGPITIKDVVKAEKFSGRQSSGSEPYTDVVLTQASGNKFNVSMKGPTAPSLAGGGMKGLETIIPGIAKKFMESANKYLLDKGLKKGDKVPDLYGKISDKDKENIVIGNKEVGGPIDFVYIGPMDVEATKEGDTLSLNGNLYPAKEFAQKGDLYFRLRARRSDQTFNPEAKTSDGTPKVYGVSPSKGDSAGRIVITDKVPANANIVQID